MARHSITKAGIAKTDPVGRGFLHQELFFKILLGIVAIIVAVVIVYYPSVDGAFILDDELVYENPLVQGTDGLIGIWTSTKQIDYWPMTYTTFWLEWRLWANNPTGYHLVNELLHVLDCLLIWLILRRLSIPGAFLAALLFAVHPVNVESVAWIIQRKTVLAMFFFLLGVYGYLEADARTKSTGLLFPAGTKRLYGFSFVMFVLAMLSKGSVAVFPVVILLLIGRRRKITKEDWMRLLPFFTVAAVLVYVNIWFQTHGENEIRITTWTERFLGAGAAVWFYFAKAFLPWRLTFVYPLWKIQPFSWYWWLPLCGVIIVTGTLGIYRKRRARPIWFAWLYFLIALLPVVGFVDVGFMKYSLVADRYQHLAILGVLVSVAAGWEALEKRISGEAGRRAMLAIAVVVVGVLMTLSWQQSSLYHDGHTLYTATLERNPGCWYLYNSLAKDFRKQGNIAEATACLKRGAEVKPDFALAQYNYGTSLQQQGDPSGAIEPLEKAVKLDPNFILAWLNLGLVYQASNRLPEAAVCFEEIVKKKPIYPEVHATLSMIYAAMHRNGLADASARTALQQALAQGNRELAQQLTAWLAAREKER